MIRLLVTVLGSRCSEAAAAGVAPPIAGYYSWNWGKGSSPAGGNNGVAFTGLTDVRMAIAGYPRNGTHPWCCPPLKGTTWISIGGGNAAGEFTLAALTAISSPSNISAIKQQGYDGVMFDAEEIVGPAETMVPAFATAFKACKAASLKVGVTVSHSAPYQTDTPAVAVALVRAWVTDPNIDVLSPQLYSSGQESAPQFDVTANCKAAGCTWDLYKGAKAGFAPSIVDSTQFAAVEAYFAAAPYSIPTVGYFQWKQQ